ncbi:MAG TPA: hypothetical protein VN999_13625, partial [Thermoanaerobaculia bacterium]|nr:hypothetical protein [Thermoanaerobaculia bacterium]
GSPEAESYVVKLATAQTLGSAGECHDRGSAWTAAAVDAFWSRFDTQTERQAGLWRGFLCDLTASFQGLRQVAAADSQSPEQLWFLLRFEVLRILLARRTEGDPILEEIRRAYREDLKLRFDDDHALNLFDLARRSQLDPFAEMGKWLPVLSERQVVDIDFASFDLRQQDPFMLELFELLTDLVCNADVNWASTGKATWYQPLLTRPLESAEPGPASATTGDDGPAGLALHRGAGRQVGKRVPPYDDIRSGKHSLSTFLGLVNFSVGQGKQTSRLRCLVALIRDYDDTQTGAGLSADEVKQQLEVDLQDLGLYTTTFFRNAQKFVADAMAREENRILSTDISQIARNWYSTGMDSLFARLGHRLDRILDDRNDLRLGSLRSDVVDEFFDGLLEIMLRPEERPSSEREPILLESFPFDRLLHVPLVLGDAEGARLCYARTQICDQLADAREDTFSWSRLSAQDCYEEIRKSGRIWPQRGGLKKSVDPVRHYGQVLVRDESEPDPWEPSMPLAALIRLLARIGEPRALDVFVRSLYEANAIQTLAVAGLVLHLMKIGRDRLPVENYRRMHDRLEAVVQDSVRSVEQASGFAGGDGGSASGGVASAAYMDREAVLRPLSAVGSATELLRSLGDTRCLPGWYELFSAAEAGSPDFTYGLRDRLGNAAQSKLFYVYYSLPAPRTFTEVPALGARFRGIFALIVDDSSTDVKNEVGEVADQQDIRTFIHNGVRSLGQVLDSQGLEGKLRQPGVESFVNGMLHRLKNELGKPLAVLQTLRETSSSHEIEKIDGAVATIKGIKDLFEGLRGLSEIQREVVPIRSFTTDWLGWLFLAKICVAAGKTADEINGSSGAAMAELHEIQRIGKKAEALLRADARDSWHVVDLIQRECQELEAVLQGLAAQAVKGGHR